MFNVLLGKGERLFSRVLVVRQQDFCLGIKSSKLDNYQIGSN